MSESFLRPVRAAGREELESAKYGTQGNPAVILGASEERAPRVGVGPRAH